MRLVLTIVLPLLLPTALYALWMVSLGRPEATDTAAAWRALPWGWLVTTGVGLTAVVLVIMAQFSGSHEGTYVPPHVENGTVVPGHVVPEPARP